MDNNELKIARDIDIIEDSIADIHPSILKLLLKDKTTQKNILWCTNDYVANGDGFGEKDEICTWNITGMFGVVVQPRAAKAKAIRMMRIRTKAEVFTPSWICNEQNNQVDDAWFGRKNVFNTPSGESWIPTKEKIVFDNPKKDWKSYVLARRLEITCGEAPYLVSRYDTTTGKLIPVYERIGLFDRKMRIVNENCSDDNEWLLWAKKAVQCVYGYEFQGDSVLIARENLLYAYIDYYKERFKKEPDIELLKELSNIISWNIWQMDGLKGVVPYSCHDVEEDSQISMFGDRKVLPCPGCAKNDMFSHNGIYCRIYDWIGVKKSIPYISLFEGGKPNG